MEYLFKGQDYYLARQFRHKREIPILRNAIKRREIR